MTAEIAILNKTAVALAADSKVTLSSGGRQKTYDTVDKLFTISKTEPVGTMIYGNAEFMGFPWESLIKEYRRREPRKCFDTVFEWAEDFKGFLEAFFPFAAEDEQRSAASIAGAWVQHLWNVCVPHADSQEKLKNYLLEESEQMLESWEDEPDFLSHDEWEVLRPTIDEDISHIVNRYFFREYKDLQDRLIQVCECSIRKLVPSPAASGVVIAGFGDKELLPSLIAFEMDGVLAGRLKAVEIKRFDTTRLSRGAIIPFAQTDMVHRFMQGIDPDYAVQIHESIGDLLFNSAIDTATVLGHSAEEIDSLKPAFQNATAEAVQAFWKTHERVRQQQFALPIIDMAMSLPKDELANLAESLVSLTSLQRRVSREIETVGGAIDVAVITKGDGFVWIKRKHYFSPDRNIRFVNGYFSEFIASAKGGNAGGNDDGA